MKKLRSILTAAWWLYFLTAIYLYSHSGFKWVNTVDVLLSFALLIAFSVWYVIEKFRSGPGKSRWVLGWNGALYRRKSVSAGEAATHPGSSVLQRMNLKKPEKAPFA